MAKLKRCMALAIYMSAFVMLVACKQKQPEVAIDNEINNEQEVARELSNISVLAPNRTFKYTEDDLYLDYLYSNTTESPIADDDELPFDTEESSSDNSMDWLNNL